jgi:hypothetical protein
MNSSENSPNLRLLLLAVLASLLLMCGGLGLFFLHQSSIMKGQVAQGRALLKDYEANGAVKVAWFTTNLQNFARSNPDLNPILAKYGLLPGAAAPAAPKK